VVPNGVVIPVGSVIGLLVNDDGLKNHKIELPVQRLGGLDALDCLVLGDIIIDSTIERLIVTKVKLQCLTSDKKSTVSLDGFVVDSESALAHLPIECEDGVIDRMGKYSDY
jgi:hypothetical protein